MPVADPPNNYPRLSDLAETFHSLRRAQGVRPFDPEKLARWAGPASHGERLAVQFVLTVFNGGAVRAGAYGEHITVFDIDEAYGTWDRENWAAFANWAARPWSA